MKILIILIIATVAMIGLDNYIINAVETELKSNRYIKCRDGWEPDKYSGTECTWTSELRDILEAKEQHFISINPTMREQCNALNGQMNVIVRNPDDDYQTIQNTAYCRVLDEKLLKTVEYGWENNAWKVQLIQQWYRIKKQNI